MIFSLLFGIFVISNTKRYEHFTFQEDVDLEDLEDAFDHFLDKLENLVNIKWSFFTETG